MLCHTKFETHLIAKPLLQKEVSARLAQYLPAIDPIWPRWTFFAEKNGVDL